MANINHITVHNNIFYILKLKEQLLKIQKLHNKQTIIYVIYTHTRTHTLLWCLNRFICSEILLTVLDFGTQNRRPDWRLSQCLARTWLLSPTITLAFRTTCHSHNWLNCSCLLPTTLPHTFTTLFKTFCFSHLCLQTSTGTKMFKLIQYNSGKKCVKQQRWH